MTHEGRPVGTVTFFLDDVRVATNVMLDAGTRALGTRVSQEVKERVLDQGQRWADRAFVVNDWYISAYEPIVDINGNRVGILYAGYLEAPFRTALWKALGLALLLVVTMFLSDIINNAATVLVMAPIAVSLSTALGLNADPFLMAVAVGASCAFLTPIGHKNNTLIMGPGGYRFGDYWRMGLPLEILIVLVSVPLILWAWPL